MNHDESRWRMMNHGSMTVLCPYKIMIQASLADSTRKESSERALERADAPV